MPAQAPVRRLPHSARWNSLTRLGSSRVTRKLAGRVSGVSLRASNGSLRTFSGSWR